MFFQFKLILRNDFTVIFLDYNPFDAEKQSIHKISITWWKEIARSVATSL
jgi:hypothetical protein